MISSNDQEDYKQSLKIIHKQIKQIENLVNEFSDFARMPKPILINNNLVLILQDNIKLINELDKNIKINFNNKNKKIMFICDNEQLSRVFFNILKNSVESIQEKYEENPNFISKIDIELNDKIDYIEFIIVDNGKGFGTLGNSIENILTPYFTTKKKGTGLGLAIVNKIINDHNGTINFMPINDGAKIKIIFIKNEY
jgi:two-component system nitrogen regulation sensor histidine kinase NtrY